MQYAAITGRGDFDSFLTALKAAGVEVKRGVGLDAEQATPNRLTEPLLATAQQQALMAIVMGWHCGEYL